MNLYDETTRWQEARARLMAIADKMAVKYSSKQWSRARREISNAVRDAVSMGLIDERSVPSTVSRIFQYYSKQVWEKEHASRR